MNVAHGAVSFLLLIGMAGPIAARQPERTYAAPVAPGGVYGGAGPAPEAYYAPPYYVPPAPLQPPYSRPPYLETRPGDGFADPPRGYPTPPRHYPTPPRAWPQNNLPQGNVPQGNLPQGHVPQSNFPQYHYRNPRP